MCRGQNISPADLAQNSKSPNPAKLKSNFNPITHYLGDSFFPHAKFQAFAISQVSACIVKELVIKVIFLPLIANQRNVFLHKISNTCFLWRKTKLGNLRQQKKQKWIQNRNLYSEQKHLEIQAQSCLQHFSYNFYFP